MSFWNKIFAGFAMSAVFAAPAFADGTPGKQVNRGPAPVVAHQLTPPEPGCYLIQDELGQAWSCPARPIQTHAPVIHKQTAHKPCCGSFKQTIVKEHAPVVTKRTVTHRSAPVVRKSYHAPKKTVVRKVVHERSTDIHLDLASFSGGVGNGVDGGFYGGGGAVVISGGRSFSSVLTHSASTFTFRHRGGGKKKRRGGCGKCMMGGMGGGD